MDHFCKKCKENFFPSVLPNTRGYEVGKLDTGEEVYFADLYDEYQIALQNSPKWEEWQEQALILGQESAAFKKTAEDLGRIVRELTKEKKELEDQNDNYTLILKEIAFDVDSLKWAQEKASHAIDQEKKADLDEESDCDY